MERRVNEHLVTRRPMVPVLSGWDSGELPLATRVPGLRTDAPRGNGGSDRVEPPRVEAAADSFPTKRTRTTSGVAAPVALSPAEAAVFFAAQRLARRRPVRASFLLSSKELLGGPGPALPRDISSVVSEACAAFGGARTPLLQRSGVGIPPRLTSTRGALSTDGRSGDRLGRRTPAETDRRHGKAAGGLRRP